MQTIMNWKIYWQHIRNRLIIVLFLIPVVCLGQNGSSFVEDVRALHNAYLHKNEPQQVHLFFMTLKSALGEDDTITSDELNCLVSVNPFLKNIVLEMLQASKAYDNELLMINNKIIEYGKDIKKAQLWLSSVDVNGNTDEQNGLLMRLNIGVPSISKSNYLSKMKDSIKKAIWLLKNDSTKTNDSLKQLKSAFDSVLVRNTMLNGGGKIEGESSNSSLSLTSGIEQKIIGGVTDFLASRVQEEISIAFTEKFTESFRTDEGLKKLFPTTHTLLQSIRSIKSYGTIYQLMKSTLQTDITNLPHNLHAHIHLSTGYNSSKEVRNRIHILLSLLEIHKASLIGISPIETLRKLDNGNIENDYPSLAVYYKIALKVHSGSGINEVVNQFDSVKREKKEFQDLYYGILYQNLESLKQECVEEGNFGSVEEEDIETDDSSVSDDEIKNDAEDSYEYEKLKGAFRSDIDELLRISERWNHSALLLKQKIDIGQTVDRLYDEYIDASISFYSSIVSNAGRNYLSIEERETISLLLQQSKTLAIEAYHNRPTGVLTSVMTTLYLLDSTIAHKNTNLIRYSGILAAIGEAKSSEQIAAAIESAALPAGSYRLKRSNESELSLNGYVGLLGASEVSSRSRPAFGFGLTAPVGIGYSWLDCSGSSFSLFVSLMDFGVPFNARLVSSDSSQLSNNIRLKDLVSPGISIYKNDSNSPITWGFTVSYNPGIRTIPIALYPTKINIIRFGFSVLVDIPILLLHSSVYD